LALPTSATCAFDILAEGGEDLRKLPPSMRKANLERLVARRAPKVSSSTRSSVVRSVLIFSVRPVGWD
jgi:ATP-dependent DNA ligase